MSLNLWVGFGVFKEEWVLVDGSLNILLVTKCSFSLGKNLPFLLGSSFDSLFSAHSICLSAVRLSSLVFGDLIIFKISLYGLVRV